MEEQKPNEVIAPPIPENTKNFSTKVPKSTINRNILVGMIVFILILLVGLVKLISISKRSSSESISPVSHPTSGQSRVLNMSPTPTINQNVARLPKVTGWKTYKNDYAGYQIDIPDNWYESDCRSGSGRTTCMNFSVRDSTYNEKTPTVTGMIVVEDVNDYSPDRANKHFTINGITYGIKLVPDAFNTHGYSQDGIEDILQKMSDSIKPMDVVSSCEAPAMVPLKTFPDNFALSVYHDSDGTDPVESYWPYTPSSSSTQKDKPQHSTDTMRGFMVNYVKSGDPFAETPAFLKTVTAIIGTENAQGGFEQNYTSIWHINCIDTQKDRPGNNQPYYVGRESNRNSVFSISLYGKVSNPTALWGKTKWNTNLLKQTRNVVYIKQKGRWQQYKAVGYYATMPAGYGGKPAIYLYPKSKESIKVEIHPNGDLIKTDNLYDKSISGWNVMADENGRINDSLNYLYYEAFVGYPQPSSGYVVSYSNLFTFSKDYVKELGLTNSEADEFISFWTTKLKKAPYYFVSNLDVQDINNLYPLKITPNPDTLLRVELYFKPLTDKIFVPFPRRVNPVARKGFTAVEWGAIYSQ